MPFESKRQARWMFANKPKMAKRWAHHTPSIKSLPETATHSEKAAASQQQISVPTGPPTVLHPEGTPPYRQAPAHQPSSQPAQQGQVAPHAAQAMMQQMRPVTAGQPAPMPAARPQVAASGSSTSKPNSGLVKRALSRVLASQSRKEIHGVLVKIATTQGEILDLLPAIGPARVFCDARPLSKLVAGNGLNKVAMLPPSVTPSAQSIMQAQQQPPMQPPLPPALGSGGGGAGLAPPPQAAAATQPPGDPLQQAHAQANVAMTASQPPVPPPIPLNTQPTVPTTGALGNFGPINQHGMGSQLKTAEYPPWLQALVGGTAGAAGGSIGSSPLIQQLIQRLTGGTGRLGPQAAPMPSFNSPTGSLQRLRPQAATMPSFGGRSTEIPPPSRSDGPTPELLASLLQSQPSVQPAEQQSASPAAAKPAPALPGTPAAVIPPVTAAGSTKPPEPRPAPPELPTGPGHEEAAPTAKAPPASSTPSAPKPTASPPAPTASTYGVAGSNMTRQLTPGQLQQAQGAGGWYVDDSGRNRYVSTGGLRQQGTPMPQPMAPMAPPVPKMQTVAGGSAPQPINTQPGMTQPTNTRPRLTRDMRLGMGNNLNLGKRAPSIGSPTGSAGLTGQPKVPKSPSMMGSGLASSRAGGVKGV